MLFDRDRSACAICQARSLFFKPRRRLTLRWLSCFRIDPTGDADFVFGLLKRFTWLRSLLVGRPPIGQGQLHTFERPEVLFTVRRLPVIPIRSQHDRLDKTVCDRFSLLDPWLAACTCHLHFTHHRVLWYSN